MMRRWFAALVQAERRRPHLELEEGWRSKAAPVPMREWLASLPPAPPMFEPEPPDPTWKDDRG